MGAGVSLDGISLLRRQREAEIGKARDAWYRFWLR